MGKKRNATSTTSLENQSGRVKNLPVSQPDLPIVVSRNKFEQKGKRTMQLPPSIAKEGSSLMQSRSNIDMQKQTSVKSALMATNIEKEDQLSRTPYDDGINEQKSTKNNINHHR